MTVLNKRVSGIPVGAVYVGRGSRWGNPFVMKTEADRDKVCDDYEALLKQQVEKGAVTLEELSLLQGKDLVCFCAPRRCHAHALEKWALWAHLQLQAKETDMAFKHETKEYKLIVAGGRDFANHSRMHAKLFALAEEAGEHTHISLVSGMARGADAVAHRIAREENIQCYEFPADWDKYGKSAGFKRNTQMAEFADGLLAFWDGKSRGTLHMIQTMKRMGKPVIVERY